jgi:hypothetical protein
MQVLINGALAFSGSEKQALSFAQSIAAERQKSEPGKLIKKIWAHGRYVRDDIQWKHDGEIIKLSEVVKKAAFPAIKIEFVNN